MAINTTGITGALKTKWVEPMRDELHKGSVLLDMADAACKRRPAEEWVPITGELLDTLPEDQAVGLRRIGQWDYPRNVLYVPRSIFEELLAADAAGLIEIRIPTLEKSSVSAGFIAEDATLPAPGSMFGEVRIPIRAKVPDLPEWTEDMVCCDCGMDTGPFDVLKDGTRHPVCKPCQKKVASHAP